MKLEELIDHLTEILISHGDLEVSVMQEHDRTALGVIQIESKVADVASVKVIV